MLPSIFAAAFPIMSGDGDWMCLASSLHSLEILMLGPVHMQTKEACESTTLNSKPFLDHIFGMSSNLAAQQHGNMFIEN